MRTTLIIAGTVVVLGGALVWYDMSGTPSEPGLDPVSVESASIDETGTDDTTEASDGEDTAAGPQNENGPIEEVVETREEADTAAERIAAEGAREAEQTAEEAPNLLAESEEADAGSESGSSATGGQTQRGDGQGDTAGTDPAISATDPATPEFGDSDPGIEPAEGVGDPQIIGDTPWELEVLYDEDGRIDVDALDAYFEDGDIPQDTRERARRLLDEIREAPQADAVTDRVEELRDILDQSM